MSDGQVIFEIKGDNSGVKQSLKDTTKAINDESKKWDSAVDDSSENISGSLIGSFAKVAASAAFAKIAQMLIQLGVEGIHLASDLEEVQNVVDVTFGTEGSKKIEKWANEASSNFGLTELQAKRYSSTLGAMMKSSGMAQDEVADMSMSLAGLAADMASFYNLDFDTAFSKIQSGMAGMSMPLRQLGIDMSETALSAFAEAEGLETAYSKMSESEQIMVRYQYLMKATSDAQGDFVRTSDSFANSQRRVATGLDTLKVQIGESLLPFVTDISNGIADLLEMITYQPPETVFDRAEKAMADASAQAVQAEGILDFMDKLKEKYGEAATKTEDWATALEELKTVFPDVNKYINEETGELTASNEQLRQYVENSKQAAIEDAKKAAIADLNEQYVTAGKNYYTAEVKRDLAQSEADAAREALVNYINSRLYEGEKSLTDTGNLTIDQLKWIAQDRANNFGDSQEAINNWVKIFNDKSKEAQEQNNEMTKLSATMSSLESELAIANTALDRLSVAAANASANLASVGGEGADGIHAGGLDFVPWDGYKAILHRGERIETATEASLRRSYGLQAPTVDYASMLSNLGGDVYLDGRIVGQVMSAQQAKSYKSLTRSGWRG